MAKTQNPNVPNNFGETPIALALQGYHIWIVLLLRIGANLQFFEIGTILGLFYAAIFFLYIVPIGSFAMVHE